ncbi:hypothetical protein HELRODRAFT_180559 [Helobdella robusta]|uniref:Uncharacterized protein n=1 Tax=Helobdella robusta TaxID=6412 RepID=T1FG19_HELRO|nr:hypothetical protein HELRODRAFT_180559 [Helobdella robusta]ESN93906.1 hypothetical protein HELRODRAFT_180559 [Helobdella robusta]
MNTRPTSNIVTSQQQHQQQQQYFNNNSVAIRQEIQRFESVHPSIYAIYDLIEAIPDLLVQQQLREHGILGTVNSGKSALVHRYLTGTYLQDESPEAHFTQWVDAVVFVFSLENEISFNAIYSYFAKMAHHHSTAGGQQLHDIPIILVGTQDAISESNPRLIDDSRARKLAADLKRCTYYETCATYGLNVERQQVQKQAYDSSSSGSGSGVLMSSAPFSVGLLMKKSNKPLNKDWKKKYVTLLDNGVLAYHPSLHDYMNNAKGKEINLLRTTVKIPGQRPRGSEMPKLGYQQFSSIDAPNELASNVDVDSLEFHLVSLDNTVWQFQAQSLEERDEWVTAIEQQILICLQANQSDKSKGGVMMMAGGDNNRSFIQRIRNVKGNNKCADCNAINPDWASLNLGTLICIECSGIHRNLGSHLSKVKSLELDEWPNSLVQVMVSIGNNLANEVWEANMRGRVKPDPYANRS